MTTYVEPANARLGDVVQDMVGFAVVTGEIVGIDTQGPAILVRWHDSRAMDVYSVNSPAWDCFGIVRRDEPALKCESCGAAIMADESGCPSCGRKNLNEATFVEALCATHETWRATYQGATLTAIALDAPLVTQCPDCGADVPTIFEHVGGCPEQPTCNHDGVNTESLAEQEVLAQHGFAITAQSGVEVEESDLVPPTIKLPWST